MLKDKELKLLTLALDSAATDSEATNAASKLIKLLRKRKATVDEFVDTQPDTALAAYVTMPFGKYKGFQLCEIDSSYLHWALTCNIDWELRKNIQLFLYGKPC